MFAMTVPIMCLIPSTSHDYKLVWVAPAALILVVGFGRIYVEHGFVSSLLASVVVAVLAHNEERRIGACLASAKAAEGKRDLMLAKYHHYEVSSAAFQIAIVLASAREFVFGLLIVMFLLFEPFGLAEIVRQFRLESQGRGGQLLLG